MDEPLSLDNMPIAEVKKIITDDVRKHTSLGDKDIKKLEQLIDEAPYNNASYYNLDRMFTNAFAFIPKAFPGIQKSYFDLAVYYLKNYDIKECDDGGKQTDPVLTVTRNLVHLCYHLLDTKDEQNLPQLLGKSEIYEQIAREIMQFYSENKDNLGLLQRAGYRLSKFFDNIGPEMPQLAVRTAWDIVRKEEKCQTKSN